MGGCLLELYSGVCVEKEGEREREEKASNRRGVERVTELEKLIDR